MGGRSGPSGGDRFSIVRRVLSILRRPFSIFRLPFPVLLSWLPVALWMGVIFLSSSRPITPGPFSHQSLWGEVLRNASHVAAYAILAALSHRAVCKTATRPEPGLRRRGVWIQAAAWAFGVAIAYAILDEWHQSFVPGRRFALMDMVYDAAGAALAIGLRIVIES